MEEPVVQRKESKMRGKDWLKIVVMPIVIAVLAAILGIYLQNRSFERNTLFKAKLDQIQAGQKEAVTLLQDLDSTLRFIRTNEEYIEKDLKQLESEGRSNEIGDAKQHYCGGSFMQPSIETLRRYQMRTIPLKDYSAAAGQNNVVNQATDDFSNKLGALIECMENKECRPCNGQHDDVRDSLRAVIAAHTKMANDLIGKY